jgi:hypothetical protein
MIQWPDKVADETVLVGIDFADRLDSGVTLTAVTWSHNPGGISHTSNGVSGTIASVRLTGGATGKGFVFTAEVTTSDGQTLQESAVFHIRSR